MYKVDLRKLRIAHEDPFQKIARQKRKAKNEKKRLENRKKQMRPNRIGPVKRDITVASHRNHKKIVRKTEMLELGMLTRLMRQSGLD